jgi:hypothetical protein
MDVVFLFEWREGMLRRLHLYAERDRAIEAAHRISAEEL